MCLVIMSMKGIYAFSSYLHTWQTDGLLVQRQAGSGLTGPGPGPGLGPVSLVSCAPPIQRPQPSR